MSDRLFQATSSPSSIEGPGEHQSARLSASTTRTRWCSASDGGPSALCGRLLAHLRLAGRRSVRRPDLHAALVRRRSMEDGASSRPTSPSRCSRCSASRSSPSTTRHRARRARASPRATATSRRDRRLSSPARWRQTGVKLLWGTANLFSNRRFMAGAATNPDPDVFAYAAATGEDVHRRHPRAEGRELRAVGRPRGLRDAAQHRPEARAGPGRPLPRRWSSTTSTRSASRARS